MKVYVARGELSVRFEGGGIAARWMEFRGCSQAMGRGATVAEAVAGVVAALRNGKRYKVAKQVEEVDLTGLQERLQEYAKVVLRYERVGARVVGDRLRIRMAFQCGSVRFTVERDADFGDRKELVQRLDADLVRLIADLEAYRADLREAVESEEANTTNAIDDATGQGRC